MGTINAVQRNLRKNILCLFMLMISLLIFFTFLVILHLKYFTLSDTMAVIIA